ncbi:MAG: peroxiredoxin family protein [Acidobacteria bacterium]|nr:peroxiredoxin family protein [Acidobacteriota bacterium]
MDTKDTEVFGISIDAPPSNAEFAKKLGVTFQLLSDMTRKVSKDYGILNDQMQFANRTTFVVDKEGVIKHIEDGQSAVDPTNAIAICTGLKEKSGRK